MFADTRKLSVLILSYNKLSALYKTMFEHVNLTALEMEGNQITDLNSRTLIGLNALKTLSFRKTSFSSKYRILARLEILGNISQLDLSFNKMAGNLNMTELARNEFMVDLSDNNISRLIFNQGSSFTNFQLFIANNSFVCDCFTPGLLTQLENQQQETITGMIVPRVDQSLIYVEQMCIPHIIHGPATGHGHGGHSSHHYPLYPHHGVQQIGTASSVSILHCRRHSGCKESGEKAALLSSWYSYPEHRGCYSWWGYGSGEDTSVTEVPPGGHHHHQA